ncbi:MAG: hypothetical protein U1F76_14435 [Candidatus Competibacteraceae bacterium]
MALKDTAWKALSALLPGNRLGWQAQRWKLKKGAAYRNTATVMSGVLSAD